MKRNKIATFEFQFEDTVMFYKLGTTLSLLCHVQQQYEHR